MPKPKTRATDAPDAEKETDKEEDSGKEKSKVKTATEGAMRTDAGVKPLVVDDKKLSLEDRLKSGLMAAYKDRIAIGA